jgi:hypothetical protein
VVTTTILGPISWAAIEMLLLHGGGWLCDWTSVLGAHAQPSCSLCSCPHSHLPARKPPQQALYVYLVTVKMACCLGVVGVDSALHSALVQFTGHRGPCLSFGGGAGLEEEGMEGKVPSTWVACMEEEA